MSSSTLLIPSQSYSFASVTFTPQMMQVYNAVFEATLEQSTRFGWDKITFVMQKTAQGHWGHVDIYFYSVTLQHRFFSFCFRLTLTSKSKALEFHLTGESVLPHVSVLCPTVRNSAGSPMMHFGRVSVGNRHTRPLVLLNNGCFPVQVSSNENSKEICSFIFFHSVEQQKCVTQTPLGFRILQFTFTP